MHLILPHMACEVYLILPHMACEVYLILLKPLLVLRVRDSCTGFLEVECGRMNDGCRKTTDKVW